MLLSQNRVTYNWWSVSFLRCVLGALVVVVVVVVVVVGRVCTVCSSSVTGVFVSSPSPSLSFCSPLLLFSSSWLCVVCGVVWCAPSLSTCGDGWLTVGGQLSTDALWLLGASTGGGVGLGRNMHCNFLVLSLSAMTA